MIMLCSIQELSKHDNCMTVSVGTVSGWMRAGLPNNRVRREGMLNDQRLNESEVCGRFLQRYFRENTQPDEQSLLLDDQRVDDENKLSRPWSMLYVMEDSIMSNVLWVISMVSLQGVPRWWNSILTRIR